MYFNKTSFFILFFLALFGNERAAASVSPEIQRESSLEDPNEIAKQNIYLPEYFEPFLRFGQSVEFLNQCIGRFQTHYPVESAYRLNEGKQRVAVFSEINQKDERVSPFFELIQNMNHYVQIPFAPPLIPKTPLVDCLKNIYMLLLPLKPSRLDECREELRNDLMNITKQVGPGWHKRDDIYYDGIGEIQQNGEYVPLWPEDCTVFATEELPQPIRSFILTREVASISTCARKVLKSLEQIKINQDDLFDLFSEVKERKDALFEAPIRLHLSQAPINQEEAPQLTKDLHLIGLTEGVWVHRSEWFRTRFSAIEQQMGTFNQEVNNQNTELNTQTVDINQTIHQIKRQIDVIAKFSK